MLTGGNKFNKAPANPRILVCPLEWGLGHATRCIPIIRELIDQGAEVLIGAEGATLSLLKAEFPGLKFLPLMGYRMRYSRNKYFLPLQILLQTPKILFTIRRENRWLKNVIDTHYIHAVISDNRFGLYNPSVPSVYITHQLLIRTGNKLTERLAQRIHYHFIKKYTECWIPDFREVGLAGILSHPSKLPRNIKYIGALSRFSKQDGESKYDLLVTISGPEPQRTMFEKLLLDGVKNFNGSVLFVRGLPGGGGPRVEKMDHVEIVDHLPAAELNKAIENSALIISRAGYTTIMDMVKLGKKAILIPTPGQTEQEYLATHLMSMGWFYCIPQNNFSLATALKESAAFPFNIPPYDMNQYKKVIREFLRNISM